MKIVTSEQMRVIEQRSEEAGVSTDELMENAGLAVAQSVRRELGSLVGAHVMVLVGRGNNGGDGLVVARRLRSWGCSVSVFLTGPRPESDPKLAAVTERDIHVGTIAGDEGLAKLSELLAGTDIVVDAVLGTGRSRPIEGVLRQALALVGEASERHNGPGIIAVDLPSGVDGDTGAADDAALAADLTITPGRPKTGLYRFPGAMLAGEIEIVDIGLPDDLDGDVTVELMTRRWASAHLPERSPSAHKGSFGKTMVVAGSSNYIGAAHLATAAAGRAGAGLITLAIPRSLVIDVAAMAPEPTYIPLPESAPGVIEADSSELVLDGLNGYSSLLVGCGLGQAPETADLVERLLLSGADLPPVVIDADGLNLLPKIAGQEWWKGLSRPAILTPHSGEMARLTGLSIEHIEGDRVAVATKSAVKWNAVVVLKGAFTVVATPDGRATIAPFANPAMASAGTGDVLAGTIAGFLAQGLSPETAAILGVFVHGRAGEAIRRRTGDSGLLASDLLRAIPRTVRRLRRSDLRHPVPGKEWR
jgi:ADP-dependent NAD(P)H-hydrate dehydratase / NAD(P)H-hydrate epimerase